MVTKTWLRETFKVRSNVWDWSWFMRSTIGRWWYGGRNYFPLRYHINSLWCAQFLNTVQKIKNPIFRKRFFKKIEYNPLPATSSVVGNPGSPFSPWYFCQTLESRNKCLLLGKALKVRLVAVWRLYKLLPVLPTAVLVLKKKRMAIRSNACRKCCQGYISAAEATQDNILSTHK